MTNYTFAFASAKENAPEINEEMGAAPFPKVNSNPAKPPLGGFNLAVSNYSSHKQQAFEAAACLSGEKSELTATELDGLPPSHENLYTNKVVEKAYPRLRRPGQGRGRSRGATSDHPRLPGRHLGAAAHPAPTGKHPRRRRGR